MTTRIDWKLIGQFLALLNSIYTLFRDAIMKVTPNVGVLLEWSNGPGRALVTKHLEEIALECRRQTEPIEVLKNIDLKKEPGIPENYTLKCNQLMGDHNIERWFDGLRIEHCGNSRKVWTEQLLRSDARCHSRFVLDELQATLKKTLPPGGNVFANATLLDALLANPAFIPETLKEIAVIGAPCPPIFVFFGSTFTDHAGNESFRTMHWAPAHEGWLEGVLSMHDIITLYTDQIIIVRIEALPR